MTISGAGNVGIATTAPAGKLHVYEGDAGAVTPSTQADTLVVENSAEGGITIMTPDASSARIRFTSPSTESGDEGGADIFYRQNINKMKIGTIVSGGILALHSGADNQTMTLAASGNVGLGTTDPQATLHVNGSINIGNHATMMSKATTGVTNPSISFNVKHANDAGWYNHAIAYNCVYSWNYSGSDSVRTGVIHIKKYATTLAMANDYTDQTVGSTINVSVSNVDRYNFTVTFSVTASAPRSMAATITHTGMSAAWGIT
jgi:hypothetical protein